MDTQMPDLVPVGSKHWLDPTPMFSIQPPFCFLLAIVTFLSILLEILEILGVFTVRAPADVPANLVRENIQASVIYKAI